MAAVGNLVVEETNRQVNMDSRSIAGLAIGIDCAAVPDCFQCLNPSRDHPPRSLAVGRRDQPDAAGIAFKFGTIHAFAGKAFVFGGRELVHRNDPSG